MIFLANCSENIIPKEQNTTTRLKNDRASQIIFLYNQLRSLNKKKIVRKKHSRASGLYISFLKKIELGTTCGLLFLEYKKRKKG